MNTYLKIEAELPLGLDYLNLNSISILDSMIKAGDLISAFNFTGGRAIDAINATSNVVGELKVASDGLMLDKDNFINTNLKELNQFTILAVIKPLKISNDLAITTFTHEKSIGDANPSGIGMAPAKFHAKQQNESFGVVDFTLKPRIDEYAIISLSRNAGKLRLHTRINGESIGSNGSCTTDVQQLTSFGIGYTVNAAPLVGGGQTVYCYAAIHAKSMSDSELKKYVDDLAAELNALNPDFKL